MRRGKRLSFVVVTYNDFSFTRNCVESIYNQFRAVPIEVIVVDNGSTCDCAMRLIAHFKSRIRLVRNTTNHGYAAACNLGIDRARGDYIIFLNNDLRFIRRFDESITRAFRQFPSLGILGFQLLNEDGSLQETRFHFPTTIRRIYQILLKSRLRKPVYGGYGSSGNQMIRADYVKGALLVVPRKILDEYHLRFDENYFMYHEEMDFAFQLGKIGKGCMVCNLPVAVHYGSNHECIRNPKVLRWRNESLLYFIRKNRGYPYFILFVFTQILSYGVLWIGCVFQNIRQKNIYEQIIKMNARAL